MNALSRLEAICRYYGVDPHRARIPCPAHHGTDRNLRLFVGYNDYVGAYCHSHGCEFKEIAKAIQGATGTSLYPDHGPPERKSMADYVTARYQHPDGKPRLSYRRDYPRDFPVGPCGWKGQGGKAAACGRTDPHKHPWTRGTYAGTLPKIWGEDDGSALVLVEGEKDAAAVQEAGFVAVSLMGGALHARKSDFTMFADRHVLVWPDRDDAGSKFTSDAIPKMREAGALTVRLLQLQLAPKGGAGDYPPDYRRQAIEKALADHPLPSDYVPPAPSTTDAAQHNHPTTADPHNIPRATSAANISRILKVLGFEFRHNIRERMDEVSTEGGWGELDRLLLAFIRERIAETQTIHKAGVVIPMELSMGVLANTIDALMQSNRVDPFKDWLEGLPAWDGFHLLDDWMSDVFKVKDRLDDLMVWTSRFIFMGPVVRAYQPGAALPQSPLLMGPTGIGKSLVLSLVVPSEHRETWFTDDFDIAMANKSRVEKVLGAVVVEMGEMRGYSRADLSDAKSFLTRNIDKERLAYGRTAVKLPRRFITVGTANQDYRLPWETALQRRLVPVFLKGNLEGKKIVEYMDRHRAQLFAEAKSEVMAGKSALISDSLLEQVFTEHEHIRMTDDAVENAVDEYLHNDGGEPQENFTLQELLIHTRAVEPSGPRSILPINEQYRWGKALRQRGYASYRTHRAGLPITLWRRV